MYNIPNLVFADKKGNVFDHPVLKSVFKTATFNTVPYELEMIPMPQNTQLKMLTDALPYAYDQMQAKIVEFSNGFPVYTELPAGYVRILYPSYKTTLEEDNFTSSHLAPVGWMDEKFVVPAIFVEKKSKITTKNFKKLRNIIQEDEKLNFLNKKLKLDFLENNEILIKSNNELKLTQKIIPFFLENNQPLVITIKYDLDDKSYGIIRELTDENITFNLNINSFSLDKLNRSLNEFIDTLSFDIKSCNPDFLTKESTNFDVMIKCFEIAEKNNLYISVNLLTLPGFTDSINEYEKTVEFLNAFKIDYLKLRELKTIPHKFFSENKIESSEILGLKNMLKYIKKRCKRVKMGYFSRAKQEFHLPSSFKLK